jgi:hypothetical protein
MEDRRRIELAFPKYDEAVVKGFGADVLGRFSTSIEDITNWFMHSTAFTEHLGSDKITFASSAVFLSN